MIAGIDGGGTHTRLELRADDNTFLRRETFGAFNLNSIGETQFRTLLREVFAACGELAQLHKLCIGAAGISNPKVRQILEEELHQAGFAGQWKLCGDQEIALRGAMDCPGIALISGTGSICFGKNGAGETARSGGFGHLIDDGGSGYALGRDVLTEAVRALDGRGGDREILQGVYDYLGVQSGAEIVSFVYSPKTDKSIIAQVCIVAIRLAEQGNRRAWELLQREAAELAELVRAVQNQLNRPGCPIALLGGMLDVESTYHDEVVRQLSRLGPVQSPAHDALWGAAQMAFEM